MKEDKHINCANGWLRAISLVALAATPGAALAELSADEVEAAKNDGAINVYYCDSSMKDIVENFGTVYPEIKVTTYLDNCLKVYARYSREAGARRSIADVFMMTEDVLDQLQADGQLQDYQPAERDAFPAMAKPEGRNYTLIKTLLYGLTANKDVPQPKDWVDFIEPPAEWQNMTIYFDPRTSTSAFNNLVALEQSLGRETTEAIFAGMRDAGAELSAGSTAGLAKLLSGEKAVTFYVLSNQFQKLKRQGADLDFIVPTSGTMSLPFGIALSAQPSNPAAAKLFVDYMLTEGQTLLVQNDEFALRNDVGSPEGMPALSDVTFLEYDREQGVANRDATLEWWQSIMGLR